MKNNIFDTALIFEGGGMRVAHTAGITRAMLENELYFDYVAGISAGSSNAINYILRDADRAKKCFVDIVDIPDAIGIKPWLKGQGYFSADYLYGGACMPGGPLEFDLEKFDRNPAQIRIGAYDCKTGKNVYWSRQDADRAEDMLRMVRCSSTLPFMMPQVDFKGHPYIDGGLNGGLALEVAIRDGFDKFFIILTQEKGYRKAPFRYQKLIDWRLKKHPILAQTLRTRWLKYNAQMEQIEKLEAEGKALVVRPDKMELKNTTSDRAMLEAAYADGYALAQDQMDAWKAFLFEQ